LPSSQVVAQVNSSSGPRPRKSSRMEPLGR
jgi:hypothetical protein